MVPPSGQTAGMDFAEMMQLDAHGVDTFVGIGPAYPWGGLYGGQIVAQALGACGHTVDPQFLPHSLHAYFIRPGDSSEPIRFEVDRLRNGRSFVTRQVVARQSGGAILTMIASFQVTEDAADVQTAAMPPVSGPDELVADAWTDLFDRRSLPRGEQPEREQAWMRVTCDLDDDPLLHACGIAFMSDDLPTEPLRVLHPLWSPVPHDDDSQFMTVSLDHAMWFHRPARADEWHLEDFLAGGLTGARGLTTGNLFGPDGTHIATVAQEALIRVRRPA
jgi:acyl-CoA thioesterase II